MAWVLGLLGAMLGLAAGAIGKEAIGMFGGALIGALCGICIALRDRIDKLERYLGEIDTYMRALAAHLNHTRDGTAGAPTAHAPRATAAALAARGIEVTGSSGRIRAGIHLYNDEHDIDRLIDAMAECPGP